MNAISEIRSLFTLDMIQRTWLERDPGSMESIVYSVAALFAIACLIVGPLTFIRFDNSFTVGYGASVAAMAATILTASHKNGENIFRWSPATCMAFVTVLYGVRLAAYLQFRRCTVKGMQNQTKAMDGISFFGIFGIILAVSLLYALMVSPLLFQFQSDEHTPTAQSTAWLGVVLAFSGFIIEIVADQHKYNVKKHHNAGYGDTKFVGPTNGLYSVCRHPNFLGEIIFWFGLYVGGAFALPFNVARWLCCTVGFSGIASIMFGSSDRLDKKHEQRYRNQPKFEEWKNSTKWSIIPYIK